MCKTLSHFRTGFILTEYILFLKKNFWATLSVLYDLWTTEEGEMKREKNGWFTPPEEGEVKREDGEIWQFTAGDGWREQLKRVKNKTIQTI